MIYLEAGKTEKCSTPLHAFPCNIANYVSLTVLQFPLQLTQLHQLIKLQKAMEPSCSVIPLVIHSPTLHGPNKETTANCLHQRLLIWQSWWEKMMDQCTNVQWQMKLDQQKLLSQLLSYVNVDRNSKQTLNSMKGWSFHFVIFIPLYCYDFVKTGDIWLNQSVMKKRILIGLNFAIWPAQ